MIDENAQDGMITPVNVSKPPPPDENPDKWPDTVCVYIYSLFNGRNTVKSHVYFDSSECEVDGKRAQNEHGLDYILTLESKDLPLPDRKDFVKHVSTLVHCNEMSHYMKKNCQGCLENLENQSGHLCSGLSYPDKLYVVDKTRTQKIYGYINKFLYMYDLPNIDIHTYVDAYKYYRSDDCLIYDVDNHDSNSEFSMLVSHMLF